VLEFLAGLLVGFANDLLLVQYYLALMDLREWQASAYALIITLFTVGILGGIVITKSFFMLAGYAVGTAVGTYVGVKGKK